jgi:type IV secretion system protein VirB5
MNRKTWISVLFVGLFGIANIRPAHAQFAVIDVASIAQLVQEVQQLEQQVATAKSQLSQAQSEYAAITGNRGMQSLLSGQVRNYLPTDWAQINQVLLGASATFPALAASVTSLVNANAILTPVQVSALSPSQQSQLAAARQNPALLAATARAALANASSRFAALQGLITAIGSAADQKASLDLTARITAEQGMLQNEATKLQMLFQVAQSQEWSRMQQVREQALADQGSLRTLPAMGL